MVENTKNNKSSPETAKKRCRAGRKKGVKNRVLPPMELNKRMFYVIAEAAQILRVTDGVIVSALRRKILTGTKIGRQWKIFGDDLFKYFQRMRVYKKDEE